MYKGYYTVTKTFSDHLTNILHHANTKAFTNAFFPALGWALGLLPLVLALRF